MRLVTNVPRLTLALGEKGHFSVVGIDAAGYQVPVQPSLSYDTSLLRVSRLASDYLVEPLASGASLITLSVDGSLAYLPVSVGSEWVSLNPAWVANRHPAEVEVSLAVSPQGARLTYDFSGSRATRAAYLETDLPLPGAPVRLRLAVYGDGQGAWLKGVIRDATGTPFDLEFAQQIDWVGWRSVSATIPAGARYPLHLWRIYPVEIEPERQYAGSLGFADLEAELIPTVEVPQLPPVSDPLFGPADGPWRFAVLSDFHLKAGATDALLDRCRLALRQAAAAEPDFIVINGDLVETAYAEDFALATRLLADAVDLPVYYLPGNHEVMGTGDLTNYRAALSQPPLFLDHKGVRFIFLNTAHGNLHDSDPGQLVELEAALATAGGPVVVFGHHPTRDPKAGQGSDFTDQAEARWLEARFTLYVERTGQALVYIAGHAHALNLRRHNGVPYLVLPPVGKAPYAAPDQGGFYGWVLCSMGPEGQLHVEVQRL